MVGRCSEFRTFYPKTQFVSDTLFCFYEGDLKVNFPFRKVNNFRFASVIFFVFFLENLFPID